MSTIQARTLPNLAALVLSLTVLHGCSDPSLAGDALPSWNEGPAKQSIIDFVAEVTEQGGSNFVPVEERIATFDNDGTLWCEQPYYTQLAFAFDRVADLVGEHPEWKEKEPFKSALAKDLKGVLAGRA